MEKDQQKRICWNQALNNQSPKHSSQRIFTVSACGCIVVMIKRNRNNFIKVNVIFEQKYELRFVRFKIFYNLQNICQRELFCGIIDISPFGAWFMVSEQPIISTNREGDFDFSNKKMPYSCGLVAFRKRLKNIRRKEKHPLSSKRG